LFVRFWKDGGRMAKTAMTELQQQIEEVRREAFAAGYAAAMQAIRELASRPPPGSAAAGAQRRRAAGGKRTATAASRRRQVPARGGARRRRATATRPPRGANAERVAEILQSAAPRPLRAAEIRKGLLDKGIEISFTSVRHALGQLEARNAAEQVGDSRTWRHRGGAS
jgi:hypothetical protein